MTGVGFPTLSTAERDRRYAALRALMAQRGLAAIVVFPGGTERLERYISNEIIGGTAILPLDGEPTLLVGRHPLPRFDAIGRGYERWVDDIRLLGPDVSLPGVLEHRFGPGARIGIVGLSSRSVGMAAGTIAYPVWARMLQQLPQAEFVDVSVDVEHLVLVKSAEELRMIRKSAELGEDASAAFVAASRVGARESEAVGAMFGAIIAGGGEPAGAMIIERAGPDRFGWAAPEWLGMGGGGRILEPGDTISAEIFSHYAGYQTQQQIDVSLGEPGALLRDLEAVCIESYRIGVELIRPGAVFSEIALAMEAPIKAAGFWNTGPQIQTVSPVMYNSATHEHTHVDERLAALPFMPPTVPLDGDFVLEPGVVFAVQPNALLGGRRVSIGGAVVTTADRAEELNSIALRLNVVDA